MLNDSKAFIIRKNEETYKEVKVKTTGMLEYLRNIYREIRDEEDPP